MTENLFALLQNSRGWNAVALALGAFVVYVVGTNIAWRAVNAPHSSLATNMRAWTTQRGARALFQSARLVYYLGLPFLALYFGWVDLRSVGLSGRDWTEGMRWTIVILLAAWLLLILIWLPYLHATLDVAATPQTQFSFARRMVEVIYMQAHWLLYRAAAIMLFTDVLDDALYWGAIGGLGMICIEALLDPRLRARLQSIGAADAPIWNFGQAFINTLTFLATHILWLGLMIQFLLELTVPHLRATRATTRPAPTTAPAAQAQPTSK